MDSLIGVFVRDGPTSDPDFGTTPWSAFTEKIMKHWIVAIVVVLVPLLANAQVPPGLEGACTPPCRTGYLCHQGQCVSACNPPCGEAEVCASTGECVSRCNPACAANELCSATGQCLSKCNPMCGPGAQCTPAGVCVGAAIGVVGGAIAPVGPADEGWASAGGKLGIVSAIAVAGMVTAIVIADDEDVGIPVGSAALVIAGVTIPVVGRAGASARNHPAVIGSPGLRLAGWIFYGLSIADGLTLLGLAISDVDIPPAVTASVGALGTASAVFMSLDAFSSAAQARELGTAPRLSLRPYVGAIRDADNATVPTTGLAWSF
jgi:hypothetical protein